MPQSILYISVFYLFCFLSTIIAFPFSFALFSLLKDRGVSFTKLFFFLSLSYISWLSVSTLGIPYNFFTLLLAMIIISLLSLIQYKKHKKVIKRFIIENKKLLLFEEVLFLSFFIFFILVRFGNPDLWHPVMGGEKPMDFAFINSLVKTESLPPYDPWFSGQTINYYYFGQYITATLVKLLAIPSSFFYNIFISFLFAQTAVGMFSLGNTFTNSRKAGLLATLFLIGMGNLAQVPLVIKSFSTHFPINAWYWNATRVMPNFEINEFPFFTFIYADLHSHLITLPIIIFFIYSCYGFVKERHILRSLFLAIFIGVILGILRMTNVWDYPTFSGIFLLVCFYKFAYAIQYRLFEKIILFILMTFVGFSMSVISIVPFLMHYKTGSIGLSIYEGPYTRISDYLLIHGFFLFIITSYVYIRLQNFSLKKIPRIKRLTLFFPAVLLTISLFLKLYFVSFILLYVLLLLAVILLAPKFKNERIMLFLVISALLLTLIPDLFNAQLALGRMNTVFKTYYQAWIFFAITSSYFAYHTISLLRSKKILRIIWITIFLLLLASSFTYVPTATISKVQDRMSTINSLTLDGEEYMKHSVYFENNIPIKLIYDYLAIQWIKRNIGKPEILLEATTPIYRWGSRISVYTGLPTVLGWDWHEIAHRQYAPREIVDLRSYQVREIYESDDKNLVLSLLKKHKIRYIYIGQLEKVYYKTQGLENIIKKNANNFHIIYNNPEVHIYEFIP